LFGFGLVIPGQKQSRLLGNQFGIRLALVGPVRSLRIAQQRLSRRTPIIDRLRGALRRQGILFIVNAQFHHRAKRRGIRIG